MHVYKILTTGAWRKCRSFEQIALHALKKKKGSEGEKKREKSGRRKQSKKCPPGALAKKGLHHLSVEGVVKKSHRPGRPVEWWEG